MRKFSTAKCVAVVGNCQAASVANCVRQANPRLKVKVISLARQTTAESQEQALRDLGTADTILVQPGGDGLLGSSNLTSRFGNVVLYPKLTFYGFHPDFFLLRGINARPVASACGFYHSKIVAAGFSLGLPERRVLNLFNSFVFARLGYFGRFAAWKKVFLSRTAEAGYELDGDFELWLREGAFMHTLNHPAIRVIASIAERLLHKAEIALVNSPAGAADPLARAARLPVYPEIARAIGVDPVPCFTLASRPKSDGRLSVSEFVRDSYRLYGSLNPGVFETDEIKAAREILRREIIF
jgi:hypothetical protein